MKVWRFIVSRLKEQIAVSLLYVVDSNGSSPGRKGFVMAVDESGEFEGTIGGGIMEVKMVELAKSKMKRGDTRPILKDQFHDKQHKKNQSGLICSGSQQVTCVPLGPKDLSVCKVIDDRNAAVYLTIDSEDGLSISDKGTEASSIKSADQFRYTVNIEPQKTIHIFGAGHVGVALARQMTILDYKIVMYDDRPELASLSNMPSSYEIKIVDYNNLGKDMQADPSDVVVLASFSYRSDKLIIKQLHKRSFTYIGMMGSDHKIRTLTNELIDEGICAQALEHVFAPIGLNMFSKTAAEIAVSIAGQIILEANKNLNTGRSYD